MTKEILKLSATFLGLYDVVTYINNPTNTPNNEVKNKIDELLVYMNYVIREVTKEYYPLSYCEDVKSNNQCEIDISLLTKNAIAIKEIKQNDNSVTFNLYPTYIKVGKPNLIYNITYNYIPESISNINQPLNLPLGLEYFIIAYGIASEYALSKLLYDEANMWESKFKNSLESIKIKVKERKE